MNRDLSNILISIECMHIMPRLLKINVQQFFCKIKVTMCQDSILANIYHGTLENFISFVPSILCHIWTNTRNVDDGNERYRGTKYYFLLQAFPKMSPKVSTSLSSNNYSPNMSIRGLVVSVHPIDSEVISSARIVDQ